jgi:predicted HD phosphohydrolase
MDRGDVLEWITVGFSATAYAEQHPDTVLHLLRLLDRVHIGYPTSVLAHSLQTATRARRANASDELVLCALCHHLGSAITYEGQAELSAAILRGFVSEDAYRIVRHQDEFQLFHYGAQVDRPSSQRERYVSERWYGQARTFCDEWDSPSYATDYASLPLEEFEPLVRAKLGTSSGYLVGTLTSEDCIAGGKS